MMEAAFYFPMSVSELGEFEISSIFAPALLFSDDI